MIVPYSILEFSQTLSHPEHLIGPGWDRSFPSNQRVMDPIVEIQPLRHGVI